MEGMFYNCPSSLILHINVNYNNKINKLRIDSIASNDSKNSEDSEDYEYREVFEYSEVNEDTKNC